MSEESKSNLPRRDYMILPALILLSAVTFLALIEFGARCIWRAKEDTACDQRTPAGDRYKPNCTAKMKLAEGPWVQNSYNECGYRSASSCRAKEPNTIRIALLGSSTAEGFLVPFPETFASRSEKQLARECGRRVEIQNLAVTGIHPLEEAHRLDEALALHPDAVLFLVSPTDLAVDIAPQWDTQNSRRHASSFSERYGFRADMLRLKVLARQSTAFSMLRHYYFQDDQTYLRRYLEASSDATDYLRDGSSTSWQKRFDYFDSLVGDMAARTRSAGVPVVLISSVSRPQVALLDSSGAFPGLDAFAFDHHMAQIAERHGVPAFGVIDDFSRLPHATDFFYVADGHLNGAGHGLLAESITRQILESGILGPAGCSAAVQARR